ncbi:MAG: serine/threonine protein kinase [Myxococcales bacterium]|nr:serine/threonine protein kinase [Myxococcales bacterium]
MQLQQQQIPGLEVLTKLCSGGMGDILLARRRSTYGFEKLFAVKVIKVGLAQRSSIRAMFLDEARLVAQLNHPTIAQVYDFGEVDETLYLSMEYIPGVPLNQLIQRGPLPPLVAARIAAEVARGLHAAHELTALDGQFLGVVHRDVSPGNLILNFDGRIKILDFGIAFMKQRESPDTAHGERKGKPSYMAPEQLLGQRTDRRSDIYSLSVVLYEMLTGRKLFRRSTAAATAIAIIEREKIDNPSDLALLPDGLDDIVMQGLAKKPTDRFETARQLADKLEQLITREQGASLETYAEDVLMNERQAHRSWLQHLLRTRARASSTTKAYSRPSLSHPAAIDSAAALLENRAGGSVTRRERLTSIVASARRAIIPDISGSGSTTVADSPRQRAKKGQRDLKSHQSNHTVSTPGWVRTVEISPSRIIPAPSPKEPSIKDRTPSDNSDANLQLAAVLSETSGQRHMHTSLSSIFAIYLKTGLFVVPVIILIWFIMNGQPASINSTTHDKKPTLSSNGYRRTYEYRKMTPVYQSEKINDTDKQLPASSHHPSDVLTTGWLSIGAVPRVLVHIDKQPIGRTPIVRFALPRGFHRVELVAPESGKILYEEDVEVQTDQHARITYSGL